MAVKRNNEGHQPHVAGPGRARTRRSVRFSDAPDEVMEVVDIYPSNFFCNECDMIK